VGDIDSILEHLNAFNSIVTWFFSIGVNMYEEDLYMTLLCFLTESQNNLVMALGSTIKNLVLNEIVAYLL
jgi:hypothetical protein